MSDLARIFAALDGAEIPGGCGYCNAYQTTRIAGSGVLHLTIHHDDGCPVLVRLECRCGRCAP